MPTKTDWDKYDYCETCDANPGIACEDLRYARASGRFSRDYPHKGRPRKTK